MEFEKQLKLLYEKLLNISCEISKTIEKQLYLDIPVLMARKEQLLKHLKQMHKINKDFKLSQDLLILKNKVEEQELKNLEFFKNLKGDIKKELDRVSREVKLQAAYSQNEVQSVIVDVRE